jgi:membrane fusion protein (multidrug efflux system)
MKLENGWHRRLFWAGENFANIVSSFISRKAPCLIHPKGCLNYKIIVFSTVSNFLLIVRLRIEPHRALKKTNRIYDEVPMRKRYIPLIIGLITVFFGAGLLLFPQLRSSGEKTSGHALAKAPSQAPVPVVTAMVTSEPFTEKLEALGTTKANESVVVTPTVEERVVAILVDDGEFVNKGQVLVKLDDSEAQYLLAEARAALKEQQQQFERMRRLAKTNATSRSQLDEEQGLLEIAVAKVSLLEARLQDYTIRAPFSGTLGIRQISTGAVVDTDTVITTLDDTTTIKLDFTVPEAYLGVMKNGMTVSARSLAYPDRNFDGLVTAISSRVDPETRTLTIRAKVPNPDRLLRPGMLLTVDLVKNRSQSLIIPEEAVIQEKDRKFALLVTPDNTVEKKEIVTGRRNPGKLEVISGLNAGQQVIIQGLTRVRSGSSVNVVEAGEAGRVSG